MEVGKKSATRWQKPTALRLQAKHMILVEGKNLKETAKALGLNEKTVGQWNRVFKWTATAEQLLSNDSSISLLGFMVYISKAHPTHFLLFEQLYNNYTNELNKVSDNG